MRVPSIALWIPPEDSYDATRANLTRALAPALGSVRVQGQPQPTRVGGYPAVSATGTGKAEGFTLRFRVWVVDAPYPVVILGLAPTFLWGGAQRKITAFVGNIGSAR